MLVLATFRYRPKHHRSDVRFVKAARKAGLEIAGVRVSREGDIVILARKPRETNDASQAETANPWDEVLDRATNEKRAS
jgi:hypothetical protein